MLFRSYDTTLWTWAPEEVEPIQVRPQPSFPVDQPEGETGMQHEVAGPGAGAGAGAGAAASMLEETTSYVGIEGWRHTWGTPHGYSNATLWKTAV